MALRPAPRTSSPRLKHSCTSALRSVVARSLVCRSRTSSMPIIRPRPRTSPMSGCLSISACSAGHHVRADDLGVLHQAVAQQPDRRQRRRARDGVAAERARVRPGGHDMTSDRRGRDAERQPRRDPLRHRHDVGLDAGVLDREHPARCGPCPTALRPTISRMPCWRRELAQPLQERVRRDDVAALALDRLDDDRRHFVRRRRGARTAAAR